MRARLSHDRALQSVSPEISKLAALAEADQQEWRRRAIQLGQRIYGERPKQFAQALKAAPQRAQPPAKKRAV